MKKFLLLLILICLLFSTKASNFNDSLIVKDSMAQLNSNSKFEPKYILTAHILANLVGVIKIGNEFKLSGKKTLKLMPMIGYQKVSNFGFYNHFQIGLESHFKFYFGKKSMQGFYTSPFLYYNFMKYDYTSISETYVRNEKRSVYRTGILLGYQAKISQKTFIDFAIGPSYTTSLNSFSEYLDYIIFGFQPHLILGIGRYIK